MADNRDGSFVVTGRTELSQIDALEQAGYARTIEAGRSVIQHLP